MHTIVLSLSCILCYSKNKKYVLVIFNENSKANIHAFLIQYEKALLRGYVECCSNLTWCTNPQGCDQILCKEGLCYGEACSKCSWISCFSCNFPEVRLTWNLGGRGRGGLSLFRTIYHIVHSLDSSQAHYPASCSHMSQWMDDGGFYEGMTVEAQSKHLAKLISKRCPSCQAQIEKNEGCLQWVCFSVHFLYKKNIYIYIEGNFSNLQFVWQIRLLCLLSQRHNWFVSSSL